MKKNGKNMLAKGLAFAAIISLMAAFPAKLGYATAGSNPSNYNAFPAQAQDIIKNATNGAGPGQGMDTKAGMETSIHTAETANIGKGTLDKTNEANKDRRVIAKTITTAIPDAERNEEAARDHTNMLKRFREKSKDAQEIQKDFQQSRDQGKAKASAETLQTAARTNIAVGKVASKTLKKFVKGWQRDKEHGYGTVEQWAKMCKNDTTKKALNMQKLCDGGGGVANWSFRLYQYARLCASHAMCSALKICDLCDGGLGKNLVGDAGKNPGTLTPTGFVKAGLIQAQASGGGGGQSQSDCDYEGAGINFSQLSNCSNISIEPGKDGWETVTAAIIARTGFPQSYDIQSAYSDEPSDGLSKKHHSILPASYILASNTDNTAMRATHNMALLSAEAGQGDMASGILASLGNNLSVSSGCQQHQKVDKMRQKCGFKQNSETCLSNNQLKEGMQCQETIMADASAVNAGNSGAESMNQNAMASARSSIANVTSFVPSTGNVNAMPSGGGAKGLALFQDPIFLALLENNDFHRLVVAMRDDMPKIYAEERYGVAEIVAAELNLPSPDPRNYFAEVPPGFDRQPASGDDNEVIQKPYEKSASLGQLFAASGVNITGMSAMPIITPVKAASQDVPEVAPMKAILVSGHAAQ